MSSCYEKKCNLEKFSLGTWWSMNISIASENIQVGLNQDCLFLQKNRLDQMFSNNKSNIQYNL